MHPNDIATLIEILSRGQFGPVQPNAFGLYARGVDAQQYSSPALPLPLSPVGSTSDSAYTKLLAFNTASGAPRTWQVRAALRQSTPVAGPGVRLRVRWSVGQNTDVADIDFRSGTTVFPITAESLTVMAIAAVDPATIGGAAAWDGTVAECALSGAPLTADWRAPTLTEVVEVVPGNLSVQIPRHAQQVEVLGDNLGAAMAVRFAPTAGGAFNGQAAFTGKLLADIPAGSARIDVVSPPLLGTTMAFTFRLGL